MIWHEALVWLDAHPEAAGRFKANAAQYARQHLEQSAIIERFLQQVG
jgi:ABC-type nitrate/sulfonate/bicarbonate transport system substrate-binding protein